MTPLAEWQSFYVVAGSSAGALIGLQFVVMTLIANRPVDRGAVQASNAFATPSVVHFGAVLLLSALLSAPVSELRGQLLDRDLARREQAPGLAVARGRAQHRAVALVRLAAHRALLAALADRRL